MNWNNLTRKLFNYLIISSDVALLVAVVFHSLHFEMDVRFAEFSRFLRNTSAPFETADDELTATPSAGLVHTAICRSYY